MDVVGLAGLLSLARMIPILEVAVIPSSPFVAAAVTAFGALDFPISSPEVDALIRWRREIGPVPDASDPEYFHSTAATIAVFVAAGPVDREWRIRASIENFWNSCDDLLHRGDGYRRSEFQGIRTTLRGVEDEWRKLDLRQLAEAVDPQHVFEERKATIRKNLPRRREVARLVAECAGWPSR